MFWTLAVFSFVALATASTWYQDDATYELKRVLPKIGELTDKLSRAIDRDTFGSNESPDFQCINRESISTEDYKRVSRECVQICEAHSEIRSLKYGMGVGGPDCYDKCLRLSGYWL
jgi:hypothetical protein